MLKSKGKIDARVWLLAALIGVLVAAGWAKTQETQPVSAKISATRVLLSPSETAPAAQPTASPPPETEETAQIETAQMGFEAYRAELEETRQTSAKLLDEVLSDGRTDEKTAQRALEQKTDLARRSEMETSVETLLASRGFSESLCVASEGSVSIVVRTDSLTQNEAAQILDIAMSETGAEARNIRIIPTL